MSQYWRTRDFMVRRLYHAILWKKKYWFHFTFKIKFFIRRWMPLPLESYYIFNEYLSWNLYVYTEKFKIWAQVTANERRISTIRANPIFWKYVVWYLRYEFKYPTICYLRLINSNNFYEYGFNKFKKKELNTMIKRYINTP